MRYKLEKLGCYLLIIILLPYIVTVFLNGPVVVSSTNVEKSMVCVKTENGQVDMTIEDYGIGILAREIPLSYEADAIKVQAILVRTKIYRSIEENGSEKPLEEEFWTKSQMEEAWGLAKFSVNYNKLESAWRDTQGQVLMYENELAYTPFFSLSNGSTRDANEVLGEEYPYLKIKDCPLDIEAAEQIQTVTLPEAESELLDVEVLSIDTAGYVLKVRVGEEEVSGEEFRNNYQLASSCFSVQEYEGKIRITTRGVGHGIGLSQYTANKMAEEGKSYEEILSFFYEGCELQEVADLVRNSNLEESTKIELI